MNRLFNFLAAQKIEAPMYQVMMLTAMTTQIAHNAFAASELALGTLFSLTSATMIFGSLNNTRMGSRVISKLLSRPS